jgi:DNA (cytosine-5)-methyltransferase 1
MPIYKLQKKYLKLIYKEQLNHFLKDFDVKKHKSYIEIEYEPKYFNVNDDSSDIIDSKIQAIGLFTGAGGLDIGAQLAGSKVISSLDFDFDSVATMRANKYFEHAKHYHQDIRELKTNTYSKILSKNTPEKLIIIGGPPCQPFSKAGYWVTHRRRLGEKDPRNMIGQYLRIIDELQPDGFVLENVESLLHPKNIDTVNAIKEKIDAMNYNFILINSNSLDFGVPQKRKRIFFIASKTPINNYPLKTHGDNDEIKLNDDLMPYENVLNWIGMYDSEEYFESEEVTKGKTYSKELRQIPPGKNYFSLTKRDNHPNPVFEPNKRFWSFLLKLHPCLHSWTIAAQPGPWVGPIHWNNRRLRVPEIAALQTFPKDYQFYGSRRSIQKQIGNAVPTLMSKGIVRFLMDNL